ncbi:hypothetical protein GIB67_021366, partial [Kingdonia uniflora]
GKEPYKAKPSDILIISDSIPKIVSNLQRFSKTWTFASVTKVGEDEDSDINTYLKVRTLKAIEVKEGMRESLFAIFIINITTNNRIWFALHMVGNLVVVKEVLSTKSLVKEACQLCSRLRTNVTRVEGLGARLLSALNESQRDTVLIAISTLQCYHITISCAPTNVAIAEVATRVLKLVRDSYDSDRRDISLCSLGDLLLFGNNDRLKVDGDLQDVFLDYRVDRLLKCFAPLTGYDVDGKELEELFARKSVIDDALLSCRDPQNFEIVFKVEVMLFPPLPRNMFGPYSFISMSNGVQELDDVGHSRKNMVEVSVVMKIVRNLFKGSYGGFLSLQMDSIMSTRLANENDLSRRLKLEFLVQFDGVTSNSDDLIIVIGRDPETLIKETEGHGRKSFIISGQQKED